MTPVKISIIATLASLVLLAVVFELIRGRKLKERYALLWILTGVVLLVLSAWRGGLQTIAGWMGVSTYPPAILFAVATLFVIIVLLYYSTVLSRLADQNTLLAQRVALLEQGLTEVGDGAAAGERPPHREAGPELPVETGRAKQHPPGDDDVHVVVVGDPEDVVGRELAREDAAPGGVDGGPAMRRSASTAA